jgi:hypothetical protein
MGEERAADEPRTAAWRTVERLRSDGVAVVALLHADLFGRVRSKQVGALGADLVGVCGALTRAECEAYASAVTDWEWAHDAFHT